MFTTYRWFLFQNRTNAFFGDIIWWRYIVLIFLLHVFLYYIYIYYMFILYILYYMYSEFSSLLQNPHLLKMTASWIKTLTYHIHVIYCLKLILWIICQVAVTISGIRSLSSEEKPMLGNLGIFFPLPEEEDMTFINILTWLILTFPFKYEKERGIFLFSSLTKEHSRVLSWEYGQITTITKDGFNKISVYKWQ